MKRYSRTPANLSESVHRQLSSYALAAGAAGVGVLASNQPCHAEIVYTKAHRQIAPHITIDLDLNHDGIADFILLDIYHAGTFSVVGRLSAFPIRHQNQIWGRTASRRHYASALFAGHPVGPGGQFLPGAGTMAAVTYVEVPHPPGIDSCTGPWANVSHRYLGLKFAIKGKVHFGWARLDVTCSTRVTALLTGYAYETIPNKPIITGKTEGPDVITLEPGSLGRLAQGSRGLVASRRKESASGTH